MKFKAPKGTNDILPARSGLWQQVEHTIRETAALYGYGEIRTPAFESVELFKRSVGEETDIVNKEMYTFSDRAGRVMALRPEGTAPVVRAYLQHRIGSVAPETRLFYLGPMFRYERPQKGRYRQFNQFGVEFLGSEFPEADVEVISLICTIYDRLGLSDTHLKLNSVGCPKCRPVYHDSLAAHLNEIAARLCADCASRAVKNPLRVFDCKNSGCREMLNDAPRIIEALCSGCSAHYHDVKSLLDTLAIPFIEDAGLVRGLDYYTRTAFEIIHGDLGAQDAVGGGGRYDGLVQEFGGPVVPAVGYAGGMERLIILLSQKIAEFAKDTRAACYIATASPDDWAMVLPVAHALRQAGIETITDNRRRSMKSQMKTAGKLGVRAVVILGLEECETGTCILRNMISKSQQTVRLEDLHRLVRTVMEDLA